MLTCPKCRAVCADSVARCPVDGTALAPADPLLGKVLGERYRVVARIGAGGMGTVYRAEHVVLGKRMAVKVLRPELSEDEDLVRRFQHEAIAASQIGQENIVDVTDFGRTPQGALYFVMEELDGVSLSALLQGGPVPVKRAVLLLAQVCRALAAAHGRGIVHRDLKPDNVIVLRRDDGSDFVKVVDFGIAKSRAVPDRGRVTRAGTIIGTPEYMAPEQGAAAGVDHRADVYAFGVLAYELLTGKLPFRGDNAIAIVLEHQTKAPIPPRQLRPDLPPRLEAVVLKALAKRPEARQQAMTEVASELSGVLDELGLPPVYARTPTPPPAALHAPTRRFGSVQGDAVVATPAPARTTTGRGATVEIEVPAHRAAGARVTQRQTSTRLAFDVGIPARRRSREAPRRGRRAAFTIVALAVLVAGAAAAAWWSAPARPSSRAAAAAVTSGHAAPATRRPAR